MPQRGQATQRPSISNCLQVTGSLAALEICSLRSLLGLTDWEKQRGAS
jgi:hypothetical protein